MVLSFWTSSTINILHNSSVQIIPLKLEKIIFYEIEEKTSRGKKDVSNSVVKVRYSRIQSNESRNVLNGFLLKLRDISSNYIPNCSIHSRLSS